MSVCIRRFEARDILHGMTFKEQAGWNQIEADWRRALALQPDGCFLAEREGIPVGTVTSSVFGEVAWVAMMLVAEPLRGHGIGRALMEHVLAFLEGAGARSIRLDATPLGHPLYASLGFVAEATILRYHGAPTRRTEDVSLPIGTDAELVTIAALDRSATGTDRRPLLERLRSDAPDKFRVCSIDGTATGFSLARAGSRATQIGPCISRGASGAIALGEALQRHAGQPVIVDIPEVHQPARGLAEAAGLSVARSLTRMGRGPRVAEHLDQIWASSGPETG